MSQKGKVAALGEDSSRREIGSVSMLAAEPSMK
jgi:hypothetical protein